jgi:nicotinamide riboside transporter PnuC
MTTVDIISFGAEWLASRTWIDWGEIFFIVMSVIGQHFISARNSKGFVFWLAGNLVAIPVFAFAGRVPTALLYCYFLYKCVSGILTWRRLERGDAGQVAAPVIPELATASPLAGHRRGA